MPKAKVLTDFTKSTDSTTETLAAAVINALTGNTYFPQIGSLITNLTAKADAYSTALAIAKIGTASQTADKNAKKAELLGSLKSVADYVNFIADGDRVMLLTTGFTLSKEVRTPVILEPVKEFIVTYGENSGTMNLAVKKGNGISVNFEYALADAANENETIWNTTSCSESSCTLSGLPVGKMIFIRAGVLGPRRQMVYSETLKKMVA